MSKDIEAREEQRRAFLDSCGLGAAKRVALPGDVSLRRYERLILNDKTSLIFMDAPPSPKEPPLDHEADAKKRQAVGYEAIARLSENRIEAFAAVNHYLISKGLSAPGLRAVDPDQGFAVIEDLGDNLLARNLEKGADAYPFYETAMDVLQRLQEDTPPDWLVSPKEFWPEGRWPLRSYDHLALSIGPQLFLEWWPKFTKTAAPSPDAQSEWIELWDPICRLGEEAAKGPEASFCHRDYHAENLLWLSDRKGLGRLGILDSQDAVKAHPAWDIFHLLQDARRDVGRDLEHKMLGRYLATKSKEEKTRFFYEYHALGALNAVRILFIFARQVAGFERTRYLKFIPRTRDHLRYNLEKSGLIKLKAWLEKQFPEFFIKTI